MATAEEAILNANTPLAQALAAGVLDISYQQEVTFNLYHRVVLPLDGYLFWVRAGAMAGSALSAQLNVPQLNTAQLNQVGGQTSPRDQIKVRGSLHITSDNTTIEDANYAAGTVIFTSLENLGDFHEVQPTSMYIGLFEGKRFSFGLLQPFYRQANLYHYLGTSLNSMMATQIVEDPSLLDLSQVIVSNSLPAWLAINTYAPVYPVPLAFPRVPLFPSFLSPLNIVPPYGTIHVEPERTEGLQMAPWHGPRMEQAAFAKDRVVATLWGCNNAVAQSWLSALLQYSYDTERFGLMQYPQVIVDDKVQQSEFYILGQRKRLTFEVSYNQSTIRNIARQMILEIMPPTEVTALEDAPVVISPT